MNSKVERTLAISLTSTSNNMLLFGGVGLKNRRVEKEPAKYMYEILKKQYVVQTAKPVFSDTKNKYMQ